MAITPETTKRKTYKVVLYGAPKTGKTETASKFPKPLIAQDAATQGAAFMDTPHITLQTTGDMVKLADDWSRKHPYETLVLDDFSAMVKRWAAMTGEKTELRAYGKVMQLVVPALQTIMRQPYNVVYTCHHKQDTEVDPTSKKDRAFIHPNLPPALDTLVRGSADLVAYVYVNGAHKALVREMVTEKARITAGVRSGLALSGDSVLLAELAKVLTK